MAAAKTISAEAEAVAARVETFVREVVIPYERDSRLAEHGPTAGLVGELRELARRADVLTPHILADGSHLTQRETALVLCKSGLSPLGPLACNTSAPDEGNIFLLGKIGSSAIKERFVKPLVEGRTRSVFFMTEPVDGGSSLRLLGRCGGVSGSGALARESMVSCA